MKKEQQPIIEIPVNSYLTLKERLINGLQFAGEFFNSFYKAGFSMLLAINTVTSIIFFVYLGSQNYDTELYSTSLFLVKFIFYIIMFWIISLCLSILFTSISQILLTKQEINIVNKLKEAEDAKFKRKIK